MKDISNRISTAVVLNEQQATLTRIAYKENGKIQGRSYDTSIGDGEKKEFNSVEEAKAWVHEIAPEDAEFKDCSKYISPDHFDNLGSNRRDFEEMWGIHHEPNEVVQLLNGSETVFSRCVGYCAYHKRYITQTQLKTKECLKKECKRLIKIEHRFWVDRDNKQVEKKIKKALDII